MERVENRGADSSSESSDNASGHAGGGNNDTSGGDGRQNDDGSAEGAGQTDGGSGHGDVVQGGVQNDDGSGEGSGQSDGGSASGGNAGGESANNVVQDGNVSIEESESEDRYKCKFCTHGFQVYTAYKIHVDSRHPGWKKVLEKKNERERTDLLVAISMQQESEDSETVAILDKNDENERSLVE